MYLTSAPTDLRLLEQMYADENLEKVRYLAHKMKSSAITIGFTEGYTLFQSIENCVKNQENLDQIGPMLNKAKLLSEESFIHVKQELALML